MEIISADKRLADLGNGISDAVHKAISEGLDADVICSVIVGVAADYWLEMDYPVPVTTLSGILIAKAEQAKKGAHVVAAGAGTA